MMFQFSGNPHSEPLMPTLSPGTEKRVVSVVTNQLLGAGDLARDISIRSELDQTSGSTKTTPINNVGGTAIETKAETLPTTNQDLSKRLARKDLTLWRRLKRCAIRRKITAQ